MQITLCVHLVLEIAKECVMQKSSNVTMKYMVTKNQKRSQNIVTDDIHDECINPGDDLVVDSCL